MAYSWTDDQLKAITARGKTLLLSAAAGSGKTATLTERIIRQVKTDSDISDMLIVTYTRAAAAELRVKIFKALSDAIAEDPQNRKLTTQLTKIGSARISTIDSFYYDIVKDNLAAIGLSSPPKIADPNQYVILAQSTMDAVIEEFYRTRSDFPAFAECFSGVKQSNYISETFVSIYDNLQNLRDGLGFLKKCADSTLEQSELDFFSSSYGKILQKKASDVFAHYLPILSEAVDFIESNDAVNKAYGEQFRIDLKLCRNLTDAVGDSSNGYSRIRELLANYVHPSLKGIGGGNSSERSNMYRDLRTAFTKTMDDFKENAFSKSPETIKRAMKDTARYTQILYELLCAFEEKVSEEKSRMGIATFNDIKRMTLKLLVNDDLTPTETAKKYANQFSDIYIDEYQDVDQVQDLIFTSISKPDNRFMVGDIKQSIYEFRSADPTLFSGYRASFPDIYSKEANDSDVACIFMSENFRCDKPIIDFANLVCSKIFSVAPECIGYTPKDDLKYHKACDNPSRIQQKVKLVVVNRPSKEEKSKYDGMLALKDNDFEAEYIADEIERLLKEKPLKDNSKELKAGDIAILYRRSNIVPAISAALDRKGILTSQPDAKQYFEHPDVLTVLCVLNAIDNPERDIHLAGAMHSPLFNFDLEELWRIRLNAESHVSLYSALCKYTEDCDDELAEKCKDFKDTLESWQLEAAGLPVDRFLLTLFDNERFISTGIIAQQNDNGNGGNLLLLYEYARSFENGSFKGLYQFIEFINSLIDNKKALELGKGAKSEERVSIMSVHKSKGLEFPVCFVCGCSDSIRSRASKDSFVFDKNSGVAMNIADDTGIARIKTPMRDAILDRIALRQAEEEMRVLYVALTRAKERLYVTASSSKSLGKLLEEGRARAQFFDRHTVIYDSGSYLDWFMLMCNADENPTYELLPVDGLALFMPKNDNTIEDAVVEGDTNKESNGNFEDDKNIEEYASFLGNKFDFKYKYDKLSIVPSKVSVSRLYPKMLDADDKDKLELFDKPTEAKIPDFFLDSSSEVSAAEKGTATHLFMQFCDFDNLAKLGVDSELKRLQQDGFIPESYVKLIYVDELEKFVKSELFQRILKSKEVIREQRFNITLSPSDFTDNKELMPLIDGESLAVQGVIDLVLIDENGDIELYDYKTDRLTREELKDSVGDGGLAGKRLHEAHALQLSYYAKAAERLFGKSCRRIAIYSTHSAQLYNVDLNNLPEKPKRRFSSAMLAKY